MSIAPVDVPYSGIPNPGTAPTIAASSHRGAYAVANGVLTLAFGLLSFIAIRVLITKKLTTIRQRLFFAFTFLSCIVRLIYFSGITVVFSLPEAPSDAATTVFYFLFWLPQLFTLIPFVCLFFWWLDIYSSSRGVVLFSDPTTRRRYNIAEFIFVGLLFCGQISLFVYAVWFDASEERRTNKLSLLSIDGQALGGAQLALSVISSLVMMAFAFGLWRKGYKLIKGGMQLHFVMILWVSAFFGQGLITLLAQWLDHFRDVWYDVNGTTSAQLIGDAVYSLCEWLPTYFVLEQKFRSRIMSYTFDVSRADDDLERSALLDGVARKMTKIIPKSDLYIGDREKIGEGSFGVVYKGVYNGEEVAIKVIKHTEDDVSFLEEFCKEAMALSELSHPNVVRFIGACIERPDVSMVMEYVPRGSLRKILDDRSTSLSQDNMVRLALGTAEGMRYLHRMGVLHRDLKSDNVLVTSDWCAKITDFGLARLMNRKEKQQERMTRAVGTLGWVAPELLEKSTTKYTDKIDVYSFGVVVWEMITKELPYKVFENTRLAIARGERPSIPSDCPDFFRKLIKRCWLQKPEDRPSFDQIVSYLNRWKRPNEPDFDIFI